jgi:RHS repeat-associated protein
MKHSLLLTYVLLAWLGLLPRHGTAQVAGPPTTGLIAYYPFDEARGVAVQDATGQLAGASLTAGIWQPTAGYDRRGALDLPGGAHVDIPLNWQPQAFSVAFWLYPKSLSNYSQQVRAAAGWNAFYFHMDGNGLLYVGTDLANRLVLSNAVQTGGWQHYVFTFNKTVGNKGVGSLYRNGILISSRSDMALPQAWGGLSLGNTGDALYDELRVYNRAITAPEASALAAYRPYLPVDAPDANTNLNWTLERSFDGNENVVAESKQFTDALGRPTQAQARNAATRQVFAAQTIYNTGGQAVLQTLAAPIDNQSFNYKSNFITAASTPYGPASFELSKASAPDAVDAATPGTLGYYFSQQNAQEPLTPSTSYPYSLVEPYEGPLGGTRRAASPGDELRMGKGREAKGRDFLVRKEFDNYYQLRPYFVPGSPSATLEYQATKSVSVNADGRESIVVSNKEGQALVSCLSGPQYTPMPVYGWLSADGPSNGFDANAPVYADVHIPAAGSVDVKFTMNKNTATAGQIRVINLLTDATQDYTVTVTNQGVTEPELHITLVPGFYRFVSLVGSQWTYYEARYGNLSYTYYDDAGRVIATVAPKGVGSPNYVRNGNFEQSNFTDWLSTSSSGWASYPENSAPAHSGSTYWAQWQPSGPWDAYTYQVVTGLPNGRYTLRAWVQSTGGQQQAVMRAKNYGGAVQEIAFPALTSSIPWQQLTLSDIVVTNGQCEVGFYSSSNQSTWIRFDDVELVQQATGPPAFTTRNIYDTSSRLLATESNDEGRSEYVYAQDGRIRFSQSALQRSAGRFSYSNYDETNRVVESGEYTPGSVVFENHLTASPAANSVLQPSLLEDRTPTGGLAVNQCAQRKLVWYDLPWDGTLTNPNGTVDTNHQDTQLTDRIRTQQFVLGAVSKTKNDNVTTWYSYDELGRVSWVIQDIVGVGVKTLDYQYDFSGNVLQVAYQKGQTDSFYHYYTYDAAQRLTAVNTSPDGTTRTLQAQYSYFLHGPLKRVQVAGDLQGIDYAYTLQGALKSINHSNMTLEPGHDSPKTTGVYKDLFALTLEYFNGDYSSRNLNATAPAAPGAPTVARYDGTIQAAAWRTGASADIQRMAYAYDEKSQLQNSVYSNWQLANPASTTYQLSSTVSPTALQEGGMSYDPNGNLLSLRRTNQAGAVTDNFSYTYKANTNQLKEVHTGSATGTTVLDYDYDELGQMTRQRDEQGQRYFTYDVTGKTTGLYADANKTQPLVTFAYDDRGFRVSKTAYSASFTPTRTTYYVRDVAGNILTVYDKPAATGVVQRSEVPLYGSGRLGTLTHLDNGTTTGVDDYRYELTDHLGDARVVFHRPTMDTGAESFEGTAAKYAFQAQGAVNYGYASSSALSTPNVALIGNSSAASGTLKRVVNVQQGDTITFTAWARTTGGFSTPNIVVSPSPTQAATASRVQPFLLLGAAATADDTPTRLETGRLTRSQAGSGNWLGRLAVGLSFTIGSKQPAASAATATMLTTTGSSFNAWIQYQVKDANGQPVGQPQQVFLPSNNPTTWQKLQLGVRVKQGSSVELTASSAETSSYVMFDNLTVEQTGGLIVQEQHQYAFGAPLPGLSYTVGNRRYRYSYQGQYAEHDDETGFESFELRLYNSRIGRWLDSDPEGQYSSPYIGMSNNPISQSDPNGGWSLNASSVEGAIIGAAAGAAITGIGVKLTSGEWRADAFLAGAAWGAVAGGYIGGLNGNRSPYHMAASHPGFSEAHLLYDGQAISWIERGRTLAIYSGFSGLRDYVNGTLVDRRYANYQNTSDWGPIQEGWWKADLTRSTTQPSITVKHPTFRNQGKAYMQPGEGMQDIVDRTEKLPGGYTATYSVKDTWGTTRVKLTPLSGQTRKLQYLHNSQKGFTHGCVECNDALMQRLKVYGTHRGYMKMQVKYPAWNTWTGKTGT